MQYEFLRLGDTFFYVNFGYLPKRFIGKLVEINENKTKMQQAKRKKLKKKKTFTID